MPGVNEPHYLAKARHYWDPGWCRGDFFLESADVHVAFFQTAGLLASWLPLEKAAWIGRALALALLAAGWTALVRQVVPNRWAPLWSAWAFLLLAALGNLSGEWIVGGVEGKVFAYGFLFLALAQIGRMLNCQSKTRSGLLRHSDFVIRHGTAAVLAGLAVSFHPLVGVWGLLAAAIAAAGCWIARWRRRATAGSGGPRCEGGSPRSDAIRSRKVAGALLAVGLLAVCSLPGLWPALQVLRASKPEAAAAANRIQVFNRLSHHLDPMVFPVAAWAGYAALVVIWLAGRRLIERRRAEAAFAWFCGAAVLIALGGLAVGLGPRPPEQLSLVDLRAWFLKFYPFRLADVMAPLAASLTIAGLAGRWSCSERWPRYRIAPSNRRRLLWPVCAAALAAALLIPAVDRNPSRMDADTLADWKDVCRWVARRAPADAAALTPPGSWAFKWYARRVEYVAHKDCPQDAAGIVEWRQRMDRRDGWYRLLSDARHAGRFDEALAWIAARSGVALVIVPAAWETQVSATYRNETFAVHEVRDEG